MNSQTARPANAGALAALVILFIASASTAHCQHTLPTPDQFVPHVSPRALAYQSAERIVGFGSLGWHLLGLVLILTTGLSVRLRNFVRARLRREYCEDSAAPPFRIVLLYYAIYSLAMLVWGMPFGFADLRIEAYFGFSHEPVGLWLLDMLKSYAIAVVTTVPILCCVFRLYAGSPKHWWLKAWALVVPVLLFSVVAEPVLISPLYNRYTPLPYGPLRTDILNLAGRAGISSAEVLVEDTSKRTNHVNAYVTGIGPSARIVINDTAIEKLPRDQMLAMLGHEMGHYVEGHIWFGFFSASLGAGALFGLAALVLPTATRRFGARCGGLRGVTDVAAIPLLLLFLNLFLLAQDPIANGISRYMEHRADAFGLRLTHLNEADARLMVGFAERDFSDPNPPALFQFWFGTHPTLDERIRFALSDPYP